MSTVKLDVQWSPNCPDRFITFGTDLSLYQVEEIRDGQQKSLTQRLSDTHCAHLLFTNSNHQYLKCVAWYPRQDHLLAVGQANGKVVLTSFGSDHDPNGLVGREFVPKQSRQCNSVTWNPVECNLLASGLDKLKTDHSILIWDILKCGKQSEQERRVLGLNVEPSVIPPKPILELGYSETTHSLQWFSHQPKTFVAGMSNKHLKIYDIRDYSKHLNITPTKAVYGVSVDPLCEHRLASYSENSLAIWDVRNFEKPILTLNEPRTTVKLAWCPTRYNLLAAVAKDSNVLKVYDVQHTSISSDDVEPIVFERCLLPCGQNSLSSFAWHPSHENRLLLVMPTGGIVDFTVFERITLNWLPTSRLIWNHGKKLLRYIDEDSDYYESLDDISVKIKQRALAGYGLKGPQLWENGMVLPSDRKLQSLWSWIDMVKHQQDEGGFKSWSKGFRFQGVKDIVLGGRGLNGNTGSKSELVLQPFQGLSTVHNVVTSKVYNSEDRDKGLILCGWGFDRDGVNLTKLLERLESEGSYEKAATVAVFNLKILRAIESLKRGALSRLHGQAGSVDLHVVAMALSGYTPDKNTLWREMSNTLRPELRDPYLRAMFAFLTCDDDSYDVVLNEAGLAVQYKVAFACKFLPDQKLADYLTKLTAKMISDGNLDGILLTGLTNEGLDLFQQYVDLTGDVQTSCLAVMQALPNGIGEDTRVQQWVESYRNLLDQWRLWHQRAQFDVQWNKVDKGSRPTQHVFISCNFCGKSISTYMFMQAAGAMRARPGVYANKTKMTSCPGCRKPLPRCAVCLMNMGTAAGMGMGKTVDDKTDEHHEHRVSKFSSWFTWCQSCKHGGHACHIIEWFKDHTECPVTSCSCKCMSLDSVSRLESTDSAAAKVM